jgi:dihydroxyacetone kinase-like protein
MAITYDDIRESLQAIAKVVAENRDYLTQLDADIGDADHGINMNRGFTAAMAKLSAVQDGDIGTILKTVGMALVGSVGGAGGPLYGTFFLRMGMAAANKVELADEDLVTMFDAGVKGVIERGKANPGDKTMIDALQPAVDAMRKGVAENGGAIAALKQATAAAEAGMKATIPMKALKGRASYLGERSIGHQDPGATSSYLMLKAITDTVAARHMSVAGN